MHLRPRAVQRSSPSTDVCLYIEEEMGLIEFTLSFIKVKIDRKSEFFHTINNVSVVSVKTVTVVFLFG